MVAVLLSGELRMAHLPYAATNDDIIAFVDEWVKLLESEDYDRAFEFTDHGPRMTLDIFREHVRLQSSLHALGYGQGESNPLPHVTLHGTATPTEVTQVKDVERWATNARGLAGSVWYNLNFDGFFSERTALFDIVDSGDGLTINLVDIGVR